MHRSRGGGYLFTVLDNSSDILGCVDVVWSLGALGGQVRVCFGYEWVCLLVQDVPVKNIELHKGHGVQRPDDILDREVIA